MASRKPPRQTPAVIRRKIRALDRKILGSIDERALLVKKLAELSSGSSDYSDSIDIPDKATPNVPRLQAEQLLRQIDGFCQSQVRSRQVSYLGPIYSYSYLAAAQHFGTGTELKPVNTIAAVFEQVATGKSMFGVVPIENSTDGRIADTLTMFSQHPVSICREIHLPIHHCLIGEGKLGDIREVRSKSQALSQCRNWLDQTFGSRVRLVATTSSSDAAQDARDQGKSVAAIASREAAIGLGLKVIAPNIEDQSGNLTRFAVIVSAERDDVRLPGKTGHDKTSVMFSIPHRPGALADVINLFKRARLNLTWIESFPKPGAFSEYTFFAEFQGHKDEARVKKVLLNLEKKTEELSLLGSYPEFRSERYQSDSKV